MNFLFYVLEKVENKNEKHAGDRRNFKYKYLETLITWNKKVVIFCKLGNIRSVSKKTQPF